MMSRTSRVELEGLHLGHEALAQIPGRHPDGVEGLDHVQDLPPRPSSSSPASRASSSMGGSLK